VISLVRSNPAGEIGFLADIRRMNVALTRARRKLLVVGDTATLAHHPFYCRLIEYFESLGAYRTVWEEDLRKRITRPSGAGSGTGRPVRCSAKVSRWGQAASVNSLGGLRGERVSGGTSVVVARPNDHEGLQCPPDSRLLFRGGLTKAEPSGVDAHGA
jgi:AAA domain